MCGNITKSNLPQSSVPDDTLCPACNSGGQHSMLITFDGISLPTRMAYRRQHRRRIAFHFTLPWLVARNRPEDRMHAVHPIGKSHNTTVPGPPIRHKSKWRHQLFGLCLTLAVGCAIPTVSRADDSDVSGGAKAASASRERARELVKAMTLDEKLSLLSGSYPPFMVARPPDVLISAGWVPGIPRLGIPPLRETNAGLGVENSLNQRVGDVATALPSTLALAATFDPHLAFRNGALVGMEARAKTFNVVLAGGANLTRDPWGGRNFEYPGEDPLLAGIMVGAAIDGIQSQHVLSTIKHFVLNPQETGRFVANAQIEEALLRESDLLAFEIALKASRPASVMCAYNKLNDKYACENDWLLNQVLKREWEFRGFVMSDWGAVHSTEKAVSAGLDQESGKEFDTRVFFGEPLKRAVRAGRVPMARIDDMVTRIVITMIETGLLDHPTPKIEQPIDYEAHAQIARATAEAAAVLLKNQSGILPLSANTRRVLVVGGHADIGVLSGGGSSQVRSVGGNALELPAPGVAGVFSQIVYHRSSPLDALRLLMPNTEIQYIDGIDITATAKSARWADMVIIFATQWRGEAQDLETLHLPDKQDRLITAVAEANPRTVVVLETGGAVLMPWLSDVMAVLQTWYPGQRGGEAIARLLLGHADPGGRLPITFPADPSQAPRPEPVGLTQSRAADALRAANPDKQFGLAEGLEPFDVKYIEGADVGYRWYARKGLKPLFPFGFGLSYTSFHHNNVRLSACRSACKKDPVSGVIGVQKGPLISIV